MVNIMNNDINDSGNIGNNGNRGKFSDRLKKIRKDKLRKRKNIIDEEESFIKASGRNILKIFLVIPSMIYSITKNNKENIKDKKVVITKQNNSKKIHKSNNVNKKNELEKNQSYVVQERKLKVKQIRDIDVTLLKRKKEEYLKVASKNINIEDGKNFSNNDDRLVKLQKDILNTIKKRLVKNLNELEILQSELYILKELDFKDVYLKECQEDIKMIKKLLSKIKALKEKYDYLKDNVDFEYMLEYDDNFLVDKILELKELCNYDGIKYIVDNYKILDEYKYLYLKIDKLEDNTIKYENYKNDKAGELKERDIDFDKLKGDVYNLDRDKEYYERFVYEQELLFKSLAEKLLNIDTHEYVSYKLKGFNKLLSNSFKYLGLLLVNPLKGLFPGIAMQTVITKNLVHNLYNNLEWEENRKLVYETIDYSLTINNAINNLDDTSSLIDSTLEEIIDLKNRYVSNFKQYENDIYGYKDAIRKINKIENAVLGTKIKIDLMKKKMLENEKQNNNKMKIIKKLNSSNNN